MAKKRADGLRQKQITINGKRRVFYGHSEREILQKIREYKEEAKQGRTFQAVADEWEEEHFPTLAYNTLKGYKPALRRATEHFKDTRIKSITPRDISVFLDAFAKKGYAKKTVTTQLLVTNMIMDKAVLDGDMEYNPCASVKVPKGLKKTRREIPTDQEIEVVKNSLNKPFGLFAYFLLYTGCRRGEALALTYGDIDRQNRVIRITKSVYHDNNRPKIKTPKTAAGTREIILLDAISRVLPDGKKGDLLFPNDNGDILTETQFHKNWVTYCESVGICVTPHQLRHAYATILYEAGVDDKDAQELLGHANISTTRDIYTHITKTRRQHTADLLNAAVGH